MNRTHRTALAFPRDVVVQRIQQQIEKGNGIAEVDIKEQPGTDWFEYTSDLLARLFTTDELQAKFEGSAVISRHDMDTSVGKYVKRLQSILDRLELYEEALPKSPVVGATQVQALAIIERMAQRFHIFVQQLQHRYDNRTSIEVNDEYDVQDLLHALLRLFFGDVRPEETAPSFAGVRPRLDFLLKKEQIVVEAKKTRPNLGAKELSSQLIEDITRYKSHPDCKILVCLVYDPEGRIKNPVGVENDLSGKHNDLDVKVIISPKGY